MPKLLERFKGFFSRDKNEDRALAQKVVELLGQKGNDNAWAGLWARAKEQALFGNKVTSPFSQVPTVYKAIKAIADNVPQAELIFKDWESEKEIYPKDLTALMRKPNPLMTYNTFMQYVVGFQALYGEVFIVKVPSLGQQAGTYKLPAELWVFNPKKFIPVIVNGSLTGWQHSGSKEFFPNEQVIHLKDFNPENPMRGFAPTTPMDKIMDIDYASLVYNKAFFDNGATLGFMLSTEGSLSDKQVARLRTWLDKEHKGANQAYKTAILESGLKPVNVAESHKDMDFIEQKRFTREELLGVWRVPKALFNITEDLNYATFVGQMKIFWQYAIMPALMKVSDGLNVGLVEPFNPQIYCEFDTSNVPAFQEDFKDKISVAKDLFMMGFTGNEINAKLQLGFEDKPWRDKWWIPISTVPSEVAEETATTPPEPAPAPNTAPVTEDPKPAKGNKKTMDEDMRAKACWKMFYGKQVLNEGRFRAALKTHFFQQRKRILESIKNAPTVDGWHASLIDWNYENEVLLKKTRKYIYAGVQDGEDFAKGLAGDLSPEQLKTYELRKASLVVERQNRVTKINSTIKNELAYQHAEIMKQSGTLEDFSDVTRKIFNRAEGRTLMQARTETSSAMNSVSQLYYSEIGVTAKKWVTAHDENVRDSHKVMDGETVGIQNSFSNGMDFPGGDGAPEEVINCRCAMYPLFRKI